jgi:hypothetical protein
MLYNLLREVVGILPLSPYLKEGEFWHEKLKTPKGGFSQHVFSEQLFRFRSSFLSMVVNHVRGY